MDSKFRHSLYVYGTRLFNDVPSKIKADPDNDSVDYYDGIKKRLDEWVSSFLDAQVTGFQANNLWNRTRTYM